MMDSLKYFIAFVILVAAFQSRSFGQKPPCWSDYNDLYFRFEHLPYKPYITDDMPEDVRVGYILLDSVEKDFPDIRFFAHNVRQHEYDTLRYIMKYLYKVVDYNPILFKLTSNYISANTIIDQIHNTATEHSPKPYLEKLLLESSIIAHVFVEDTLNFIEHGSENTSSIVTCSILDNIKGKVLPEAKVNNLNPLTLANNTNKLENLPSNYLQFTYRLEWGRLPENEVIAYDVVHTLVDEDGKVLYPPMMMDSTGSGWVKKGKEYIVFLDLYSICDDSSYSYLTLTPRVRSSATCNVYPIENGYVIDPVNELGFGERVEVNLFKNLLNQRINEIVSYGD
ncbi:MAG: hypothetical protein M9949_00490 [Candidatus Kapabacteria bacterium]|nr:hypothetical protein [Candidatus Kapabacteria bacterium]